MADGALSAEPAVAAAKKAPPAPDGAKPTQYVDHTYTDYARVHEDDLKLLREAGDVKGAPCTERLDEMRRLSAKLGGPQKAAAARRTKKAGKDPSSYSPVALPFPGKLLEVLDRGDLNAIVGWQPHGRAFIVRDPKLFTVEVLPRFFRQTKFLSFTRQLNLWGFKRITRGVDAGAYYHELFLPGRPNLAMRMKREKIKGTGIRPIPNPEKEPNFYYNYPRVQLVARAPAPLPPLPHERIALATSSLRAASAAAAAALPVLGLAQLSTAAAAASRLDSRLLGSSNPSAEGARASGLLGSLSASGKVHEPAPASQTALNADYVAYLHHRASASAAAAAAKPKSTLELELASGLYLHRQQRAQAAAAAASASTPQALSLLRTRSPEDEVAIANRRLLERLLEQPSAPLSTIQGTSLFGRGGGGLAAPAPAPAGMSLFLGHHPLLAAEHRVSLPLSLASGLPSSLGSLTSALRPAALPGTGMSSATSQVSVLTNALREARQLEEMARRHRVAALATALKQRMS